MADSQGLLQQTLLHRGQLLSQQFSARALYNYYKLWSAVFTRFHVKVVALQTAFDMSHVTERVILEISRANSYGNVV